MDTMYLAGSDEVRSAGNTIRSAAEEMRSAASNIQYALEQHQRFLDDWLARYELAMEKTLVNK